MPCNDKPTNCAPCQDCAPSGAPVLPRCQDVTLIPGTYRNATVVVNADGCISSVQPGEADLYTPDPCCAPVGGGGSGGSGLPGPPGPPGVAATIVVGTVNTGAPGSAASVVNSGTSTAAVLDFTIPRGQTGESGSSGGGASLNGPGVVFEAGLLTSVTPSWPPVLSVNCQARPAGIQLTGTKDSLSGELKLDLDASSYDTAIRAQLQALIDSQQQQIDILTQRMEALTTRLDSCCPAS